jgi:ABC-type multidrug transport system permease subunit
MTVIAADSVTFVVGGLLYLVLLITLGIIAIRKGHWVMFILGIFFPLFWLIGALLPPTAAARA